MYSELNFLWEAWLRVFTNNTPEAIMNDIQQKGLVEYQGIMQKCLMNSIECLNLDVG
jgi:hypothetical protein